VFYVRVDLRVVEARGATVLPAALGSDRCVGLCDGVRSHPELNGSASVRLVDASHWDTSSEHIGEVTHLYGKRGWKDVICEKGV
jgi:hypothetical protein